MGICTYEPTYGMAVPSELRTDDADDQNHRSPCARVALRRPLKPAGHRATARSPASAWSSPRGEHSGRSFINQEASILPPAVVGAAASVMNSATQ